MNGVEADVGAADWTLRDGDTTWWDYRRWRAYPHVPAVVGAWPEPFVHGARTAPAAVAADPPLDAALRAAGAPVGGAAKAPYRVLVGADARSARAATPTGARAAEQPRAYGLTAWIDGAAHSASMRTATTTSPCPRARRWRRPPRRRAAAWCWR